MSGYLALVLAGVTFCLLLTPVVSRISLARGLVDAPGGRKSHSASVPRLGGLAIALSATLALLVVALVPALRGGAEADFRAIAPLLVGSVMVLVVGLLDDLRNLPAWPKLCVEIVAAMVVMGSGLLIERVTVGDFTWRLGMFAWPLTLLWIVGLTNAFNLIDGVDGLAAGVSVIAGATCAAILFARGHTGEAMLLAALVGAALGFLVYNFSPATIFLGDGGSLLFGFVLATTAITGWQKGATALAAGVPLLIFALPLADLLNALGRRAIHHEGAPPVSLPQLLRRLVEPDRQHIHHRLLALGLSPRRTVLLLYTVTMLLSALALLTARFS